ncbi:uncharacterized protein LOC104418388 [Eucalyptus grandis]|uniref:uncharacterized protein LOC104418388 n=1 Tax=Eucalyptus grandis TaxID=71139 RepID=UPI00192E9D6C|nr:uncharacterized protein LOC104418388 [Eucalyptus grandis]
MLSSMTKLKEVSVEDCPKLNEIHIAGVLQSLEKLHINGCESFTRLVYVDIQLEYSHESSLILASGVFNELRSLLLQECPKILGIQVVGALESLKKLVLFSCQHLQSLSLHLQSLSLSNLKNLKSLCIILCHELRIVEGLDKLEFLNKLSVADCLLLESLIDVSTTQLPNECRLYIGCCPKLRGLKQGFRGYVECFKRYKEEESVPAVSTDPLIIWHPPMVSCAESSAQAQMRVPGKMEELLAPFEEEESVPDALTDLSMFGHPSLVSHAESSAQEQMRVPGKMEELLAPFERSQGFLLLEDQREEEEDHDAGARAAGRSRPSGSSSSSCC